MIRQPELFSPFAIAACFLATAVASVLTSAGQAADEAPRRYRIYIGTYTAGTSEGIYTCELDMASGRLSEPRLAAKSTNPSFVAIHPNGRFLYSVGEVGNYRGEKAGNVSAFRIQSDGTLQQLNEVSSRGGAPCHLVVDETGSTVLVANYTGGSVASFPIRDNGSLGSATSFIQHTGSSVNPKRQEGPHGHSINIAPGNRFAVAADLGLDKVLIYKLDAPGSKLTANDPPSTSVEPGSGPRHFVFHPGGKYAYVINELLLTVTAFNWDGDAGRLTPIQTISTVPKEHDGSGSTAEIRVHPTGKFLYGSNRGHDSIVVYQIDQDTGRLTYVDNEPTGGKTPRNFNLDPTGKYLLAENQSTNTVVVFSIDPATGALEPTGNRIDVPSPVCIRMLPLE